MEIDRVMDQIKLVYSQKSYLVLRKDDEKNTVPAPDQITLNKQSNQDLAFQTVRLENARSNPWISMKKLRFL